MRIEIISLNSDSHIFALYPCYYRIKANINAGVSYSQRINSHSYFSNLFVQSITMDVGSSVLVGAWSSVEYAQTLLLFRLS